MSITNFNNEIKGLDRYLLNPNLLNINGFNVNRLHIYRIRTFMEELLFSLQKNVIYNKKIMKDALHLAIRLIGLKKYYKVTLNEITLAALWITLRNNNISLNILKLIDISRKKLNKKITRKNIIKILSHMRNRNKFEDPREEVIAIGLNGIRELMKEDGILNKLSSNGEEELKVKYFWALKKEFSKLALNLPNTYLSGKPRSSVAAILLYIADKNVSKKMNMKPLIPAKKLEGVFDVCQFTILRNYKKFILNTH